MPHPRPKPTRAKLVSEVRPVLVTWQDAYSDTGYDGALIDIPRSNWLENQTIGFLVEENREVVKLVFEVCDENNSGRYLTTIPRRYVKSVVELVPKALPIQPPKEA